jgi:hypothetical protein
VALIVAIGLVVGAIFVRRAIDDDDASGASDDPTTATGVILCAADLGDVCTAIEGVTIEQPAVTVERLAKGEQLGADAWVVAAPWPWIARERVARQGRELGLTIPITPLARTELALYARPSATTALDGCGPAIDWQCLARADSTVRIDFEDPAASTAGLLAVIQQATSFFGSADFGSNDFRLFDRELAQLKSARATAPSGATVFERFGLFSHADVLAGLASVGDRQLQRAQLKDKLVERRAAPTVSADVIVVTTGDPTTAPNSSVREALAAAGWETNTSGANNLPPTTELPTADVIIALQDLWKGLR